MIERRYYSPPDLERRAAWRGKPIVAPIVAALLALVLMFSSPGATHEEADAGQAASGDRRGGASFDCWYDIKRNGIKLLDKFCVIHTTDRR